MKYDQLFKNLNESETGKVLVEFLNDFCGEICDVRNMGSLTAEQRLELEKVVRSKIISRILLINPPKENEPNQYL